MEKVFTLDQLPETALEFKKNIEGHSVVAFHGEMGAGKTTFINALCRAFGTHDVTGSPTFSIINEYKTDDAKIIYHMDWYRLKDEEEAIQAGVEDPLFSGNLCLVEWPDKAAGLLPEDTLHVIVEMIDQQTRRVSFQENKTS